MTILSTGRRRKRSSFRRRGASRPSFDEKEKVRVFLRRGGSCHRFDDEDAVVLLLTMALRCESSSIDGVGELDDQYPFNDWETTRRTSLPF